MSEISFERAAITFFDCDDGTWVNYPKSADFLDFISPLDGLELSSSNANVYVKSLPFYQDTNIIQVVVNGWEDAPSFFFFLEDCKNEDYVLLRGVSDVIHDLNASGALQLNADNVMDYLKFFCQFIKDDQGECFYVIENEHSEAMKGLSAYDKSRYLRKFQGSLISDEASLGKFVIVTRVLHTGYVYDAVYDVMRDGNVTMKEDTLIGSV